MIKDQNWNRAILDKILVYISLIALSAFPGVAAGFVAEPDLVVVLSLIAAQAVHGGPEKLPSERSYTPVLPRPRPAPRHQARATIIHAADAIWLILPARRAYARASAALGGVINFHPAPLTSARTVRFAS